jgi:hypothetical protein
MIFLIFLIIFWEILGDKIEKLGKVDLKCTV